MQAAGCLSVLCLLLIETHVLVFSKIGVLYCASFATVLTSVVTSFMWHFSLNGISVFLLLSSFISQVTGWGTQIFFIPWFASNYNPRMISLLSSGTILMIFFLVSLEIIQQPGGARIFSPTVYYMVASIVYAGTFVICLCTFNSGIGRLTSKDEVQALEPWRDSLCAQIFTSVFWETKLLTFGRIWMIQLTWSVVPLALPYAAENTTSTFGNDGENFLQWAIAIGYVLEFLGSVASYIPTGKFWIPESIALNTISTGVISMAASGIGQWTSWGMRLVLIVAVASNRFAFGWAMPMFPREISRRYPDLKELLVRSNALWSLNANIIIRFVIWYVSDY